MKTTNFLKDQIVATLLAASAHAPAIRAALMGARPRSRGENGGAGLRPEAQALGNEVSSSAGLAAEGRASNFGMLACGQ